MASNKNSRDTKKTAVRIVAIIACAALLITAVMPVIASSFALR